MLMKTKANLLILLGLIIPTLFFAQSNYTQSFSNCLSGQLHNELLNENHDYAAKHQKLEEKIYQLNNETINTGTELKSFQTIPVVVHIVHNSGPENISDNQVAKAMQYLNEVYANTGYFDPTTGVDVEIDFCLAARDPQNNPFDGINRVESPLTNLTVETQDLDLKANQWNPHNYLNIWVVNEITSLLVGTGVGAYAYLPGAHGMPEDGIVIEARFFGATADSTKVLAHEAGHYLGLFHTFRDGCINNDCQTEGDRICDTPPDQSTIPIACDDSVNTCNTDEDDPSSNNPFRSVALGGLGDQNDMNINYMDYGVLSCYSAFTEGQKTRMKNILSTTRVSLLNAFSCQNPCELSGYTADFTANPSTNILVTDEVFFTNNSDPANIYEWRINDEFFSNEVNPSYVFDYEGTFKVQLIIRDTINHCTSRTEQLIEALCEGEASFISDIPDIVIPGETNLNFTNTSTPHDTYEWYLDGLLYSTDTDLSITFAEPGYYTLILAGRNDNCLNFSTPIDIDIEGCSGPDYNLENHWYFGEYGGLDFSNGDPMPISDSEMSTFGRSASISDDDGNLLFYSDGLRVWDATNTVMPNGTNLLPSDNGRIWGPIIPRPYHPRQYYVFSQDYINSPIPNQFEIRYSIIDMSLNSGRGDVTDVKSIYFGPTTGYDANAAYHADGEKVWLVQRSDPKVLSTYLIDSTGIGPAIDYTDVSDPNDTSLGASAIFFNSGKRMVFTRFNFSNGDQHIVVFDFDNVNGLISNPQAFLPSTNENYYTHDFALSPDDRKLYTVMREGQANQGLNNVGIYQFYLPLALSDQVASSKTKISTVGLFNRLLLGPNGKIYVSDLDEAFNGTEFGPEHRKYMEVINEPNQNGLDCNFKAHAFSILPGSNWGTLPKFIKGKGFTMGVEEPIADLGPDRSLCTGATLVLDAGEPDKYNYLWQDGSTDHTFTAWTSGTYSVTVTNECGSVTDDIYVEFIDNLVDLGEDIISTSNFVTLNAGQIADSYLWQDGSTDSRLTVTEPGQYWVYVETEEGCFESDTINVSFDIPTNLFKSNLVIYPNPSTGLFIIEEISTLGVLNDIELKAYDAIGREVYDQSVLLDGQMEIDLRGYPSGCYFLHWSSFKNSGVFKLIIGSE